MKAKKHLGQNFLIDKNVLQKILETAAVQSTEHIVEIGPGHGVLTEELCKQAAKVTSIELDDDLIPILTKKLSQHENFELIHQDALTFTPPTTPYKIVANIPYYITSPLINHFLQSSNPPTSLTLLVQKEVGEKICEIQPKMSVLSLQVALFANAKYIDTVPPTAFRPAPKVHSAIIHLTSHNKYELETAEKVLKKAKTAFTGKRKKLSNTLQLKNHPLSDQRPQHLSIEDWISLI